MGNYTKDHMQYKRIYSKIAIHRQHVTSTVS